MLKTDIILIDDHAMFRSGLRLLLKNGLQDVAVWEMDSVQEAMQSTVEHPVIVLLDASVSSVNGVDGFALLQRKWPQAIILMLSDDGSAMVVQQALARGARRHLSKAESAEKVLMVMECLLAGKPVPGDFVERRRPQSTAHTQHYATRH
ncbi:MAG: response regulator transcription factor [Burkholderiaceae bacterium]|nr:response regulator transcription factor [Burkholderiaceae bacterium]